jgi:type VI secretion system secreted protein Hcp
MPHPFYMTITGDNQGQITGETVIEAHQDKILCQGLKHHVTVPTERDSGMPTEHRVHKKLTIFKVMERSTPLLVQALCDNENVEVRLEFYRANPIGDGTEEHYFTIVLREARIVDFEIDIPNCLETRNADIQNMEYISFAYGIITYTFEPSGIEFEDQWRVQS